MLTDKDREQIKKEEASPREKDCNHCKSQGKCGYEKDVDKKIPYTGNCPLKILLLTEPWCGY